MCSFFFTGIAVFNTAFCVVLALPRLLEVFSVYFRKYDVFRIKSFQNKYNITILSDPNDLVCVRGIIFTQNN